MLMKEKLTSAELLQSRMDSEKAAVQKPFVGRKQNRLFVVANSGSAPFVWSPHRAAAFPKLQKIAAPMSR
jgi:hypothetical protein